jgi:putative membrane protein
MKLIVRWLISALALFVAALVVPGITVSGNAWIAYAVMAVVLGLVNAIIRPLLKLLTCPLIILTLGLFTLVINALMLPLARGSPRFDIGSRRRLRPAFGALIVSVVTMLPVRRGREGEVLHSSTQRCPHLPLQGACSPTAQPCAVKQGLHALSLLPCFGAGRAGEGRREGWRVGILEGGGRAPGRKGGGKEGRCRPLADCGDEFEVVAARTGGPRCHRRSCAERGGRRPPVPQVV